MKAIKKIFIFLLAAALFYIPPCYCEDDAKKGKTVDGIYVPYGTCLDYYTDEDIKDTADKLFSMLDPESEDTKDIKKLYDDGYYFEATVLFRNYMIDRIRRTTIYGVLANAGAYNWNRWYEHADILVGYMTMDEYNKEWDYREDMKDICDPYGYTNYIDTDVEMHLDWTAKGKEGFETLTIPTYGGISGRIASRYATTGDPIYIKKYFQVMESWSMERRAQIEAPMEGMNEEERYNYAFNVDPTVYVPLPARFAAPNINYLQRAADIIGGLAIVIKAMPGKENADIRGYTKYNSASAVFTEPMDEEVYDLVDPIRFARMSYHLITGEFYRLGSYRISPNHIVNQEIEGISNYFRYMCLYKDFTFCNQHIDETVGIMREKILGSFYKDGGVLEKSFNYNSGTVETAALIGEFAKMAPEFAKKLGTLGEIGLKWNRLAEGYKSNTGILPNVGNLSNYGTVNIWSNDVNKKNMDSNLAGNKALAYESVAYPYSGYAALRDGWNTDDLYLGFFNNDYRSSGHLITGTNGILNLTAYGRTMLISGGAPWYGRSYVTSYPVFLDTCYDELNGYFSEASTRKISTVMVNGKSQSGGNEEYNPVLKRKGYTFGTSGSKLATVVQDTPLPYRWGSNDSFDFTEGLWQGGYTYEDTEKALLEDKTFSEKDRGHMADHYRSIIFVKDAKLWIVTDEMENKNGLQNEYTAIWNFAGYEEGVDALSGYTDDQVILDSESSCVKTIDETGPNLNIMNISDSELSYEKHYGEFIKGETGLGWTKGSKNLDTGGYAPRADVYVKWKDSGTLGEKTSVVSILAPSRNTENPVVKYENMSSGKDIHYYIETADGIKINYYKTPENKLYTEGDVNILAKELLLTEQNGKLKGMLLDGEYVEINGVVSKYNTYDSYIFEVGDNGILKNVSQIAVPETFEWVDNADGSYTPVYNNTQQKKAEFEGSKKELTFHDIDDHWAENTILRLRDKGIIDNALVFYPDKPVTRGDFTAMTVKALGKDKTEYKGVFSDVSTGLANAGYIQTAYDMGIISGSDGMFSESGNLTRQEAAKIICIAFGINKEAETEFADSDTIDEWAKGYAASAGAEGIMSGYENKFNPKGKLTRAEAVQIIWNILNK